MMMMMVMMMIRPIIMIIIIKICLWKDVLGGPIVFTALVNYS